MLEVILCSLLTVFPDYLIRRYKQGKRIGHEITIYSVWYELRFGITGCLMLTVLLIALIFYHHPSTSNAKLAFRTVPILAETSGRVAEVYVDVRSELKAGEPIYRLESSAQEAAVETAHRRLEEITAKKAVSSADLAAAVGQLRQAEGAYQQAVDELRTKTELRERNASVVAARDIEKLENIVESRQGAVDAAQAAKAAIEAQIATLLPAQEASAAATLAEAQVQLDKTVIRAGVDGRVEQFALRPGDFVNPYLRAAGVLVPKNAGRKTIIAGFNQITAQVLKIGMTAEITCPAVPLTIIPMVVTDLQPVIAGGQVLNSDQLLDLTSLMQNEGTALVYMEPLYEGGLNRVPPGANCIANAYSNNHDLLESEDIGFGRYMFLHAIDALALVHAALLRMQALQLPVQTLVLTGH